MSVEDAEDWGAKGATLKFLESAVEGGEDNIFVSVLHPFGFCYSLYNSNATVCRGDFLAKAVYLLAGYVEVLTNEDSEVHNRSQLYS